jgi:hypothetical protein
MRRGIRYIEQEAFKEKQNSKEDVLYRLFEIVPALVSIKSLIMQKALYTNRPGISFI